MMKYIPRRISVSPGSLGSCEASEFLKNSSGSEIINLSDPQNRENTDIVHLSEKEGRYLKDCPGTGEEYICCGYKVLSQAEGCPMECSYCILQAYFKNSAMTYYTNQKKLFTELDEALAKGETLRIGSGEFTDSLALEHLNHFSEKLINYFSDKKNVLFEVKSKLTNIERLLPLNHGGRTVLAWSLNARSVSSSEEYGSPGPFERIDAAALAASAGYYTAFHFDPLILHEGWKRGYSEVIDYLYSKVPASSIRWISAGAFRFMPGLKNIIRQRFPSSKIIYGEFVKCPDGKLRYFRKIREELYRHLYSCLKKNDPGICFYFCMEDARMWEKITG
ncbi:MAG: radical SAM protein, partial [Fibrobacterota bacterium]